PLRCRKILMSTTAVTDVALHQLLYRTQLLLAPAAYLPTDEAVHISGRARPTLLRMAQEAHLTARRISARSWVFSTTDLVRHRLSHSPHDLSLFDTSWPTHPATAWTKRPSPTPWRITKTGGATPWSDASTRPRIGPAGPPGLAATTPRPRPCWPRNTHLTTPPPRLHTTRGRPSCGWLPNPRVRSAPTPWPAIPTSAPPAPTWGCSRLGRSPFWKTTPNCPSWRFCPRRFTCAITPGSVAATA